MELIRRLRTLVQPRVLAAMLRTWTNGWCTSRRFQKNGCCIFGCKQEDSIEHYARCKVVEDYAFRHMHIHRNEGGSEESSKMANFLLLDRPVKDFTDDELIRHAVRTATVYLAFCRATHGTRGRPTAESLMQLTNEIVRSSGLSAAAVSKAWHVQ